MWRQLFFPLLFLCAAASLPLMAAQAVSPARPQLPAIRRALARRHFRRARAWLRQYLRAHPASVPAWTMAGMLADQAGRYRQGGADLWRALHLDPRSGAWENWGNHLLLAGHPRQARAAWRRALALNPANAGARFNLLRSLLREPGARPALALWTGFSSAQQLQPAIAELGVRARLMARQFAAAQKLAQTAARRLAPASRVLFQASLGLDFLRAGDAAAAQRWLRSAGAATSTSAHLRLALAQADFLACPRPGISPSAASRACLERAAVRLAALHRQRPAWWRVDYWLGRTLMRLGHRLQASRWLLRAEALAPRQPLPYAALASVLTVEHFWPDAVRQWRHHLRLAPNDILAWRALAIDLQMAGQGRSARAAMRHYLHVRPNDARAWYLMALMDQGQGALAASRAALRRCLQLDPAYAPAWTREAKLHLNSNHLRRARYDLARALNARPDYAPALARLGEWENRRGDPELALPLLLRAAHLAPRRLATWYQLSQCYLRLHNAPRARWAEARFQRLRRRAPATYTGTTPEILDWLRADLRLAPSQRQQRDRAFLRQVVAAMPGNLRARCRLGLADLAAHRSAQALPLLRSALSPHLPRQDDQAAADALAAAGHWRLAAAYAGAALARPSAQSSAVPTLNWAEKALAAGHGKTALGVLTRVPASAAPAGAAADLAALIYARQRRNNHAWAAFRLALRLNPRQPAYYRDAAVFLASRHDWPPALALLTLGLRQCPGSPALGLERAVLLQISGRRTAAQKQLRVLAANPALHRQAETLLAISYYTTDHQARAHALFSRLARGDPGNAAAWYYLALLRFHSGHRAAALRAIRHALRLRPRAAGALFLAGKLLLAGHHRAAAVRDFQAAAAARPDWPDPHYQLIRLYIQQGRLRAARQQQRRFQQLNRAAPMWKSQALQAYLNSLAVPSRPRSHP